MKIAVLGPVCKDEIIVDGKKHVIMGSPAFYIGKTLQALGIPCSLFISHAEKDLEWVNKELKGMDVTHFFSEKTLCFMLEYSSKNPDQRKHETVYSLNKIHSKDVAHLLEEFDYIIIQPLFYNNIDEDIFKQLSHKKIAVGNFGLFNYAEGNKMVKKHPEKAIALMKYIDWLFLDEEEAKFVAGKESLEEAFLFLKEHMQKIAVTRGSHGSTLFVENKKIEIPAYPPKKLVDPTGAGDSFLAGFIAGLSFFKEDYEKAGKFAAMAATASIEEKGPLKASKEDLLKRLEVLG